MVATGRGLKFAFNKEALQSYAITVATAYVISPYLDEAFGVSTDNASKITKGFDLGNVTDIAKFSAFWQRRVLRKQVLRR